jgi:hypothetical protein
VRLRNLWVVLQNVRANGPTSRVRIAQETGLTTTTVHRLTADLRRRGLVMPVDGSDRNGVGRPPMLVRFDGRTGHVVGIDVGNETTRASIADLDGAVLARTSRTTASVEGDLPAALSEMVSELQRGGALRPERLVAVGVGVAAVIETEGTIVRASMHHLWEGLQLGLQLRRDLGCEVVVSQDDHLATLAELEVGAQVHARQDDLAAAVCDAAPRALEHTGQRQAHGRAAHQAHGAVAARLRAPILDLQHEACAP